MTRAASAVAVLLAASCGGTDAGRPTQAPAAAAVPDPGSGPVLCSAADGLELSSLEDFELGAAGGGWFTNNDVCDDCQPLIDRLAELDAQLAANPESAPLLAERRQVVEQLAPLRAACEASQVPSIFDKPLPAERIPAGGRCGSRWALHVKAQPLTGWGGNVGVRLAPARDARSWTGISFWARIAPGTRNAVRLEVADPATDEKALLPDGTPPCNPDPTMEDLETGCDRFGAYVLLNGDWRFFRLPFAELRQAGWGQQAGALDVEALSAISFTFGPGARDLWIDDVAFYR